MSGKRSFCYCNVIVVEYLQLRSLGFFQIKKKALAFILKVLHLLGPKTEADLEKKPKVKVVYLIKNTTFLEPFLYFAVLG